MSQHPAPLVACRAATAEETPRNAARLAEQAEANGWRHRLTYAQGSTINRHGDPGNVIESIVLRLRKDPLAGVACWHDGKFAFAWVWSKFTNPNRIGARQLVTFVRAGS